MSLLPGPLVDRLLSVLARKRASPFGNPTQVTTQVKLRLLASPSG